MPMEGFDKKGPEETSYEVTKEGVPIELTFLTPRKGADKRSAVALPAGVVATQLPYVGILLRSNMQIGIKDQTAQGRLVEVSATIPTPEAYCYQKGLSFVTRQLREEKAKDLYYLFDLLANYPALRKQCEAEIPKLQRKFHEKWYTRFLKDLEEHFQTAESEGPVLVEEQRPGGGVDAAFRAQVRRAFQDFLTVLRAAGA
jgi:hypothetical protein